jgi:hypothetical protein
MVDLYFDLLLRKLIIGFYVETSPCAQVESWDWQPVLYQLQGIKPQSTTEPLIGNHTKFTST